MIFEASSKLGFFACVLFFVRYNKTKILEYGDMDMISRVSEKGQTVKEMIDELPPELQQEVEDFVQFLLGERVRKPKGKLKLDWKGALRDLREQYTSVELQHEALKWWGTDVPS